MSALWTDVRNAYFSYNGMGVNLFFLFVAVIYLLVTDQKRQRNLLIYEIFGILFLMTPVLANAIIDRFGSGTGSWLVYGILNTAVLTAFAAADYIIANTGDGRHLRAAAQAVLERLLAKETNGTKEKT